MNSPKHLSHQPIVSVNDYDNIDGMYRNHTDAKALSLGWAQYNDDELSLKVWRHNGERWSRQSEELPLHRNLDLTILLLDALFGNHVNQDSFLVKQNTQITVDQPHGIEDIRAYYEAHKGVLEPRLREIKLLLEKL